MPGRGRSPADLYDPGLPHLVGRIEGKVPGGYVGGITACGRVFCVTSSSFIDGSALVWIDTAHVLCPACIGSPDFALADAAQNAARAHLEASEARRASKRKKR